MTIPVIHPRQEIVLYSDEDKDSDTRTEFVCRVLVSRDLAACGFSLDAGTSGASMRFAMDQCLNIFRRSVIEIRNMPGLVFRIKNRMVAQETLDQIPGNVIMEIAGGIVQHTLGPDVEEEKN
jgi:hypothetical protein